MTYAIPLGGVLRIEMPFRAILSHVYHCSAAKGAQGLDSRPDGNFSFEIVKLRHEDLVGKSMADSASQPRYIDEAVDIETNTASSPLG